MADRSNVMNSRASTSPDMYQAVGIYVDPDHVAGSILELRQNGFSENDLGVMATEGTVLNRLSKYYIRADEQTDGPDTVFVAKDSIDNSTNAFVGSMSFLGFATVGGALVASAGLLGSPLVVGLAAVLFGGGAATMAGLAIRKSDADYLKEQIDEGHILLFVRTDSMELGKSAAAIMDRYDAFSTRVLTMRDHRVADDREVEEEPAQSDGQEI